MIDPIVSSSDPKFRSAGAIQDRSKRAIYLDLIKTILVLGMLYCHFVQIVQQTVGPFALILNTAINLITFSGFMFSFGIGLGLSSRTPRRASLGRRLKGPLVLYIGYCVSSFSYMMLVEHSPLSARTILDTALFIHLHGYSEFLATFFLLSLGTSLFRQEILQLGSNIKAVFASIVASVVAYKLSRMMPTYDVLGTLIGSSDENVFPLVQYLPWFMFGIFIAANNKRLTMGWWTAAGVASTVFVVLTMLHGAPPSRFPPHPIWVFGPAILLFLYLSGSQIVQKTLRVPNAFLLPGRHVLFFLVSSNLIDFLCAAAFGKVPLGPFAAIACTIVLVAVLSGVMALYEAWLNGRLSTSLRSRRGSFHVDGPGSLLLNSPEAERKAS